MSTYSHSRLSTFENCPLRFKFSYMDEVETEIEQSVEAFLGSRVHEVMEKIYKDVKFEKIPEINELLEFYNKEWIENWNDAIVIVRQEYDQENYKKMGERFIRDYYNRYYPFNHSKTIGLETEYKVDIDNEKKYKIHVRIDRLAISNDNTYEIHDYKTSNSLPPQEKLDEDRQLAIYAYGIKKLYPDAKKIRLIWHYLAFDKEMVSERTDAQLEELRQNVIALIKKIEQTTEFPAKESELCKWCEFRPICPNFKHLYALEKKLANEYLTDDGVKIVNKYAEVADKISHYEEELEKLREALVEFAKMEGVDVVYGSDVRAAIKNYPKLSFPKKEDPRREEFFETVKKLGLWQTLATVDVYELAKMINNGDLHPDFIKALDRFITRDTTTKIYMKRK